MNEQKGRAPILEQLDGQWQKMFAVLLWKTSKLNKVTITKADMDSFPLDRTLFTHGQGDNIEFSLIDAESAKRIAEHNNINITKLQ